MPKRAIPETFIVKEGCREKEKKSKIVGSGFYATHNVRLAKGDVLPYK